MANQQLKDQFSALIKESKTFQHLSAEEQSNLLKLYETATDDQLRGGMEALNRDKINQVNVDAKKKENEERQLKLALEIKDLLKVIDRDERKDNEERDTADSNKAAEEILAKIASIGDEPKKD